MNDKTNHTWSGKDTEALSRWLAAGIPTADVARRLGRSVSAVDAEASRLGCDPRDVRSWSRTQEKQLARFWGQGIPTRKIAERLARRPGTILDKARLLGLRRFAKPRRSAGKPSMRTCRSCGIRLPTTVPCHRANCNAVAVGQAPPGAEVRIKFSLVSSSMGDG